MVIGIDWNTDRHQIGISDRHRWNTHDGRFADLLAVINHYDSNLKTGLTDGEKKDLIAYLLTL